MGRAVSWVLVGLCVVASAAPARADDYYVTKTADTNNGSCTPDSPGSDCSLREAIITANGHGGADRIVLASGAVYKLAITPRDPDGMVVPGSGDLDITGALTIDGHGSTIDGGHIDRVLDIQGEFPVTLNDLTIQNGSAAGTLSLGGGIRILGATVVLHNCTVTLNDSAGEAGSEDPGGGIAAIGSFDAALGVAKLASLTLADSRVLSNTGSNGGGIVCVLCTLTSTGSTIAANTASASDGGGVMMVGDASSLSIVRSAVAGNSSAVEGGGVSVPFGASTAILDRSRIAANTAPSGSAIYSAVSTVTATKNWWGCNSGPGSGSGCSGPANGVSGVPVSAVEPFLVLHASAAPLTISAGGTSAATADLTFNSDNPPTSVGATLPDGTNVLFTFTPPLGSFASPSSGTVSGQATDVFTATTPGVASLSATLDGQTESVPVSVTGAPTVASGAATPISPFAATLNGTASPNGLPTSAYFDYGLTPGYGQQTPSQSLGAGMTPLPIGGGSITGLACDTPYYFRAVAVNAAGTTHGADTTFTTAACPPPTLAPIASPARGGWQRRAPDGDSPVSEHRGDPGSGGQLHEPGGDRVAHVHAAGERQRQRDRRGHRRRGWIGNAHCHADLHGRREPGGRHAVDHQRRDDGQRADDVGVGHQPQRG
ncbi:MAG: hypothetical protein DMF86_24845 [Acidobacteria bacterium]|nr:MAG: hypothetical protein DMF86_24845 [Acidobacteriota bacterium]